MNYDTLPNSDLADGLRRWFESATPVGSFLTAVLENNLREAFGRADERNARCLRELVQWLYWNAPALSWGSPEKCEAWQAKGGIFGMNLAAIEADEARCA